MTRALRVIAPIGIAASGLVAAGLLMALGGAPERAAPEVAAAAVEVVQVSASDAPATIRATGVVTAAQEVTLIPQVAGRVVEISDKLLPGGRFAKGEVLARIDPRDYQLAVAQSSSAVKQAELELQLEGGRQEIARREWAMLGDGGESALALRQPHLAVAQQSLEAARSGLAQAQINLERTLLRAPFNAVVLSEGLDVGQVVGQSSQAARLAGTDRARVIVSVPVESLRLIDIPGLGADRGSEVMVTQALGAAAPIRRAGRVVRLGGELDPETRAGQLIIEIDAPMAGGDLPLLPGAFVDAEIRGRAQDGAWRLWESQGPKGPITSTQKHIFARRSMSETLRHPQMAGLPNARFRKKGP